MIGFHITLLTFCHNSYTSWYFRQWVGYEYKVSNSCTSDKWTDDERRDYNVRNQRNTQKTMEASKTGLTNQVEESEKDWGIALNFERK